MDSESDDIDGIDPFMSSIMPIPTPGGGFAAAAAVKFCVEYVALLVAPLDVVPLLGPVFTSTRGDAGVGSAATPAEAE